MPSAKLSPPDDVAHMEPPYETEFLCAALEQYFSKAHIQNIDTSLWLESN